MTMNRDDVVKHNLVERYLRNELSDDEVADFEAFYMDDPETLDELEAAQILLSQKKMPEAVKPEPAVSGDFSPAGAPPASAVRNPWQWVSGALAAALVVVLVWPRADVQPIAHSGDVDIHVLETTRSAKPADTVIDCQKWNVVRLYVGADTRRGFASAIANGIELSRVEPLTPDGLDFESLILPPIPVDSSKVSVRLVAGDSSRAFNLKCKTKRRVK